MTTPPYARATASSSLKASPKASRCSADIGRSTVHTEGLKRPSSLSTTKRNRMLYFRDLFPIIPRNKSQPCFLAELPSELRTEIYHYVLFDDVVRFPEVVVDWQKWRHEPKYIWPAILHVCRGIRIEAAYAYYTFAPFSWHIRNLDFSPVIRWVDMLPRDHRALLARNRNIEVDVLPNFADDLTYPPPGFLIDEFQEVHWKRCEPFGNLYSIKGDQPRKHFIAFCRLASWWSWCSRPACKDVRWRYTFGDCFVVPSKYGRRTGTERQLNRFMRAAVMGVSAPYVKRAWTRDSRRKDMKKRALEWVTALDDWWKAHTNPDLDDEQAEWRRNMSLANDAIGSW